MTTFDWGDAAVSADVVIVLADPDPRSVSIMRPRLERLEPGARLAAVRTLEGVLTAVTHDRVACIVTELHLGDVSGIELIRRLRLAAPAVPVVIWTSHGSEEIAVAAMRLGVADYLWKDAGLVALTTSIREALGGAVLRSIAEGTSRSANDAPPVRCFGGADLVATTHSMLRVLELVDQAANSAAPVLLEGETGTGKEMLARAIHLRGTRRDEPFLAQNCAALSDTLLDTELFGHVRGSYTGAERDRRGLFLEAGSGTVFLDEIGDAPPAVQAKLLRVLQHREIKRVGDDRVHTMRARIVAATNRTLLEEVQAGRFRADLYFRLSVLPICVPPLRFRLADLPHLVAHFKAAFEREEDRVIGEFTDDALRAMRTYSWPGNIRELEHEVHRLVLSVPRGEPVEQTHLKPALRSQGDARVRGERLDILLGRVELALINDRLRWLPTKTAAARSLGITREALYLKLKRLTAPCEAGAEVVEGTTTVRDQCRRRGTELDTSVS